jgi:cysteine desulfurase
LTGTSKASRSDLLLKPAALPKAAPPIYLDYLASTPLDPAVRDAMLPWLDAAAAGNPHSVHRAGWRAAEAVAAAQRDIAALIGAKASEIVFTSGGTEANNLALFGTVARVWRMIVSPIEHPSVLEPAEVLRARGLDVEVVAVDRAGRVDLAELQALLVEGTAVVSVMAANNEIGTLQPLAEIGALCRAHDALFHTDAVQALSTQRIDVAAMGIDLLTLSGHKLYGPAGIGALYVRTGARLDPLMHGGGQQDGRRPGTLPVALCVALGAACRLARLRREEDAARMAKLRDRLLAGLRAAIPGIRRNGADDDVLPGCLNVTLPGIDAADLLLDLPGLAISTGSACSSAAGKPSHVLRAIGLSAEEAHASLRFGLGRGTTAEDIDAAVRLISAALKAYARPEPAEPR